MNRTKKLAINTAVLTFGKICTQFVSFLLLPLYTAILEPRVYGIADLFNSYIYLIIPVVSLMLEQGLFRFLLDCRNDTNRQKTLLSTVLCINLIEIVAYTIFYMAIQRYIQSQYKIFILIDVSLNILLNTFLQYVRGIGRNGTYSFISFLSATSIVVANVILLVVFRTGAWGLFVSTVIGRSVALVAIMLMVRIWGVYSPRMFSRAEAKTLLKYSIPFIPNQLSWWAVGVSDRTIVSWFLGIAANGLYSVANKFSSVYITFYNIFNLSWTESVSLHITDDDAEEYLEKMINSLFPIFYAVCIGIIAYMPLIFPFLIDKQYNAAYKQIPILMIAVLFQVIVGLYSVVYVALKESKEIAKTSFFAAIINIVVNILLIKFIGLYAASISTLVAYVTMAIYRYFHIKKYINIPLKHKMLYLLIAIAVVMSYYVNMLLTNILTAIFVTLYSIVSNKEFVTGAVGMMFDLMKKIIDKKEKRK